MALRIIIALLLFLSFLLFKWWVFVLLAFASFFMFDLFFEPIIIAVFLDLMYGVPRELFFDFQFVLAFLLVLSFFVVESLKKELRSYSLRY